MLSVFIKIIAAGRDFEGLFQILLFIGIAAVYAINGIIKAKSAGKELKKKDKLQSRDISATKPRYRPLDDIAAKRRQGTSVHKTSVRYTRREVQIRRPPQVTTSKPMPPTYDIKSTRLPVKEDPSRQRYTAVPRKPSVERPGQVQQADRRIKYIPQQRPVPSRSPKISHPQTDAEALKIAQIQKAQLKKQIQAEAKTELIVDMTPPVTSFSLADISTELLETQSLARAIIYSEILGKPVGLREHHLQGY